MAALAEHGCSATFLNSVVKSPWLFPRLSSVADFVSKPFEESWQDIKSDPGAVCFLLHHSDSNPDSVFPVCLEQNKDAISRDFLSLLRLGFSLESSLICNESLVNALCRAAVASEISTITGLVSPEVAWVAGLLFNFKSLAKNHAQEQSDNSILMSQYGMPLWIRLVNLLSLKNGLEIANAAGLKPGFGELLLIADSFSRDGSGGETSQFSRWEKKLNCNGLRDKVDLVAIINKWFGGNIRAYVDSKRRPPEFVIADSLQFAMDAFGESRLMRLRDNSESKAYKFALQNHLASENQRLNDMKLQSVVELAAGAGHEFNNPLAVIQGQSQFILSRMDDLEIDETREKLKGALESIGRQTKRINLILRNLMQFARPAIAAPVKFEINSVIFETIERLADWATEKKVKLNSVKDDFGSLSVFADQAQTRTILENVIRNAVEAAGIDGWVRVGVEKDGAGQLVFIVEDSGPGPEIGNVANLFDPFFSGRQAGRGKGLGLSVAWRLCQMNNGNITFKLPAETNPTRFEIYLPMNEGAVSNFSKQDQKTSMDSSFKAA